MLERNVPFIYILFEIENHDLQFFAVSSPTSLRSAATDVDIQLELMQKYLLAEILQSFH